MEIIKERFIFLWLNYLLFFKHHYWSIIALQWCISFYCITKCISYTYTYILISPPSCISPTLPIPPLQVETKYRADLPGLCGCFPLAICFTFGSTYMSMPLSHFIPAYPAPPPCAQVHSLCLRLHSCPAPRFFRTFFFFKFHVYVLAHGIYFSLSDLLHSV